MPIASLIVDDCEAVKEYAEKVKRGFLDISVYHEKVECEDGKVLLVAIQPIFYVLEWAVFNPLFRVVMRRGLRKAGYEGSVNPVNRIELVRILIKNKIVHSS